MRVKSATANGSDQVDGVRYPKEVVQEALQTTFVLKGTLKRAQLMYLRVGELLVKVRDMKLYQALKHPNMEAYARERLGLGRATLFNYLRIHDWARRSHPEWLKPKVQGFVPDLTDAGDLIWIESELEKTNLPAVRRKALDELRVLGLAGKLRHADVLELRHHGNATADTGRRLLSKLRALRRYAADRATTPPEVIAHLDSAIQIMLNDSTLKMAGIVLPDTKHREKVSA